jgi:probable HAF family extracellular repeat protein
MAFMSGPSLAREGATAMFSARGSSDPDGDSLTFIWLSGDGRTASGSDLIEQGWEYPGHGTYTVSVIVRDGRGAADTANLALGVFDPTKRQTIPGYEVFDLGTLGGNSARPQDFNDYGQVVGSSLAASGQTHAFLWENGVMRDLGTLGHKESQAQRINNAGVIAGTVWTGTMSDYGNTIAAVWRNGSGTILDHHIYSATAINESNEVIWNESGHETGTGWVWRDGSWESLGSISSWARAINEEGQIVGSSAAAVSSGCCPGSDSHAFIWENGTKRDLGLLSGKPCGPNLDAVCGNASAFGINERGQIVGYSTAADGSLHAVLWENGTVRDLGIVKNEGPGPLHFVINDRGQVARSSGGEGFFWSNGTLLTLGSLGGGETHVVDMNEAGTVVGTSRTADGEQHAFAWSREGGMVDLGTGPHGFTAAWVVGVSFRGDIVGFTAPPCIVGSGYPCWPPGGAEVRAVVWQRLTPQAARRD